ncbi:MAG: hypothetical protein AAF809_14110 [Bacteroidota bacterium]
MLLRTASCSLLALSLLILTSCASTSTESSLLADTPPEIERLAVMLDIPDPEMRQGMLGAFEQALGAQGIEVVLVETSRDPRPERIAAYGAEAEATAVLVAGATGMSLRDAYDRAGFDAFGNQRTSREASTQAFEIQLTLYDVASQRRSWTATTTTKKKGGDSRAEIGDEIATSALQAMRDDGLLAP